MSDFRVETVELDLPALTGAFTQRLRVAGLPASPERAVMFAHALSAVRPVARRRLYWTARAVFVSDPAQARPFDAVFREVFGDARAPVPDAPVTDTERGATEARSDSAQGSVESASAGPTLAGSGQGERSEGPELPVPVLASHDEVLREKRFDALEPGELAQLYQLMSRLAVATPVRRTRRAERHHHGERIDLRRTLRGSMRTGGDAVHLRRRRRRVLPRRLVVLCDISGSMEPYARAYLQFLTSAAGSARRAEAFVFATRLTRLTRALATRNPERAIQAAAAAAPDWSSGTRIGDALKTFNDRHGRRGMARGAVIVILSDGWERGDPAGVAREMERLARLAHRIVWVNPRAAAADFAPRAGGMAAALPYCDAVLSGHNLEALEAVIEAIGGAAGEPGGVAPKPEPEPEPEVEPWASATPVAGSSVAMPSGYGPKRGHTTPGW